MTPSQNLLHEASWAVLVSSYKIISVFKHLSLHPFWREFIFPEHGGPWCCASFWKSLIQAISHSVAFMHRAFREVAAVHASFWQPVPSSQTRPAQLSWVSYGIASFPLRKQAGAKKIKIKRTVTKRDIQLPESSLRQAMSDSPLSSVSTDSVISALVKP